jgi:chromate transporter
MHLRPWRCFSPSGDRHLRRRLCGARLCRPAGGRVHGWLMPGEMLAGLGLAETTPGPLMLVLVFVGLSGRGARGRARSPPWAACWAGRWRCSSPLRRASSGSSPVRRMSSGCARSLAVSRPGRDHRRRGGRHRQSRGVVRAQCAVRRCRRNRFGPLTCRCRTWPCSMSRRWPSRLAPGVALLRFQVNLFWVLGGATLAGCRVSVEQAGDRLLVRGAVDRLADQRR